MAVLNSASCLATATECGLRKRTLKRRASLSASATSAAAPATGFIDDRVAEDVDSLQHVRADRMSSSAVALYPPDRGAAVY